MVKPRMSNDLETLLLEALSLPNDQLKALAANFPPPQSWYDEENKMPSPHDEATTPPPADSEPSS